MKINEELHEPEGMTLDDEITIDQPNLKVKNREIRVTWVKGDINMSEIEIIPINPPMQKGGPRTEIGRNTWTGAACFENPLHCAFSDAETKEVTNCPGSFVKIKGNASNKNIACMNKCVAASYASEAQCQL